MCPAATESKSSNPSSKKKINKDIDLNFKNTPEEGSINNQDPIQNSQQKHPNDKGIIENSDELNVSDEEAKAIGNVKLGQKGIYTEDSIRVYLQEIGRIRLLRPDEEIELARKIADLLQLEELATQYESEKGHFPSVREWAELIDMPLSKFRRLSLIHI